MRKKYVWILDVWIFEIGVLEINQEELRNWMIHGCGDEDDVISKPGVEDDMYENGTRMLSGWVVNKKSNSSSNEWAVGIIIFVQCVQTRWGVRVGIIILRWARLRKC